MRLPYGQPSQARLQTPHTSIFCHLWWLAAQTTDVFVLHDYWNISVPPNSVQAAEHGAPGGAESYWPVSRSAGAGTGAGHRQEEETHTLQCFVSPVGRPSAFPTPLSPPRGAPGIPTAPSEALFPPLSPPSPRETRLEEALENLCERILDYSVHAERKGSLRYAKVRPFPGARSCFSKDLNPPKSLGDTCPLPPGSAVSSVSAQAPSSHPPRTLPGAWSHGKGGEGSRPRAGWARLLLNFPHFSGSESDHGDAERPSAEGGEGGPGYPLGALGRAQRGGHVPQEAGRTKCHTVQAGKTKT